MVKIKICLTWEDPEYIQYELQPRGRGGTSLHLLPQAALSLAPPSNILQSIYPPLQFNVTVRQIGLPV